MIEIERLQLIPLTAHQLRLWTEDLPALEAELDCRYQAQSLDGFFGKIVRGQQTVTEQDAAHYLFHTFWFLVRKADRAVVGTASFKNLPTEAKEVEIGYGLGSQFEHGGYMTETVQAMCRWALSRADIDWVIADTEPDNLPSQMVLRRCGFVEYDRLGTIWWRLGKPSEPG